jgi:hypothetical protein
MTGRRGFLRATAKPFVGYFDHRFAELHARLDEIERSQDVVTEHLKRVQTQDGTAMTEQLSALQDLVAAALNEIHRLRETIASDQRD